MIAAIHSSSPLVPPINIQPYRNSFSLHPIPESSPSPIRGARIAPNALIEQALRDSFFFLLPRYCHRTVAYRHYLGPATAPAEKNKSSATAVSLFLVFPFSSSTPCPHHNGAPRAKTKACTRLLRGHNIVIPHTPVVLFFFLLVHFISPIMASPPKPWERPGASSVPSSRKFQTRNCPFFAFCLKRARPLVTLHMLTSSSSLLSPQLPSRLQLLHHQRPYRPRRPLHPWTLRRYQSGLRRLPRP